jgi:hypothetical protein
VFCHPPSGVSEQPLKSNNMAGTSNNSIHHSLAYSPGHNGVRPRAVIASKRAAQNRAAQRAFRQRKERYIKDLERKAKLMDEWKQEMEQLRHQNKELVENSVRLEKQIHQQQQQIRHLENTNTSNSEVLVESNTEIIPAPVVIYMDESKGKQRDQLFLPINLKAPEQTSFASSPTSSYSSSSSPSLNGYDQYNNLFWSNESYETDFDLLPSDNKNQALNNLYADLLANQRSELDSERPTSPPFYDISSNNNPILMSRAH